jgi:predicted dehydrogenase
MKIGIIGLGSAGRKHAKHLIDLGVDQIWALRSGRGMNTDSVPGVQDVHELTDMLDLDLDGVIISNPTSEHVPWAKQLLQHPLKLFVEKPLAVTPEEARVLEPRKEDVIVGYCLRFHPLLQQAEAFLTSEMGRIFWAEFKRGYYLPLWHPGKDYRLEYMGRKELGGGVVRTLSHEIDLALQWFGKAQLLESEVNNSGKLEIDVEDWARFSLHSQFATQVNFELDFLSRTYLNEAIFMGESGRLSYQFMGNQLKFTNRDLETNVVGTVEEGHLDQMYREQMKDFLQFLTNGESDNCTYSQAMDSMELIQQISPR